MKEVIFNVSHSNWLKASISVGEFKLKNRVDEENSHTETKCRHTGEILKAEIYNLMIINMS